MQDSVVPPSRLWPLLLVALALGCSKNTIELETDESTDGSGSSTGSTTNATSPPTSTTFPTDPDSGSSTDTGPAPTERAVDILFVVDNSGSMGEEQGMLSNGVATLVNVLDAITPPIDYRVAVTTTDNGNPWCQGTGPEAGKFVATSCLSRPTSFVFNGAMTIDAFDEACGNICTIPDLGLTEPWIDVQRSTGTTNVPGDAVLEAMQCMLPQGIDGCGFEQPLESMWKAIRRTETNGESEYGFHRPGALLAVVLVTDEADCSYNAAHETIFLPEGNRVFWSDPDAAAPTSAVCWNAGVTCSGGSCTATNLDEDGNEVPAANADDDAVLQPIHRYADQLQATGAFIMGINGVNSDGSVTYQESLMDPQFQSDFGIGPGCESSAGRAVPPVRAHEIIGAISGPGNEYSICSGDFSIPMEGLAEAILDRLP
ncbi:vWA domain-containing protein [Paraliomyxa miuraensis]|uniref:hypothetical protein n=1 Tax=Paraliomyxa miuraensis TaxID=376150 RepID=UPI002256AAA6|nr:hypothetical protein [Paraliomyxa miuraensis]MCX4240818.1 hypothetical protein [Paraliomyxa miuraensis]